MNPVFDVAGVEQWMLLEGHGDRFGQQRAHSDTLRLDLAVKLVEGFGGDGVADSEDRDI